MEKLRNFFNATVVAILVVVVLNGALGLAILKMTDELNAKKRTYIQICLIFIQLFAVVNYVNYVN